MLIKTPQVSISDLCTPDYGKRTVLTDFNIRVIKSPINSSFEIMV